jgi:hypothetical protein
MSPRWVFREPGRACTAAAAPWFSRMRAQDGRRPQKADFKAVLP